MGTENGAEKIIEALLKDARRDHDAAVGDLRRNCDRAIELLSVMSLACDLFIETHAGPLGDFADLRAELHGFDHLHATAEGAYGLVKALRRALDEVRPSPHLEDRKAEAVE